MRGDRRAPAAAAPGELLCGVDVGTSSIKAVLVDPRGRRRRLARIPTPWSERSGRTEMSVAELEGALLAVLGRLRPELRRAAAVGVAGMGECGAPLDRGGRPLAPVIAWHDPRGGEVVERLERRFGGGLAVRTGRRLRTVSSAAKLGWLVDQGCSGVGRWLGVPELCARWLSGAAATEHSLASRTGWYDVLDRAYIAEVASALGIPVEALPRVVAAGSPVGRVGTAAARACGLRAGVPVTVAGHDHPAAGVGAGAGADDVLDSVGTAEALVRQLPADAAGGARPDTAAAVALGVAVSVAPGGDRWLALGRGPRAGTVVRGLLAALGAGSTAALGGPSDPPPGLDVSELVDRLAAGHPVRPPPIPAAAVWEAVAAELAGRSIAAARLLDQLAGGPAGRMLVVGGGARDPRWLAARARLAPMPVARCQVVEAAAHGAALLAGVAAGWWPAAQAAPRPAVRRVAGSTREPSCGAPPAGVLPWPARPWSPPS